jgi:hypothetical protein
MSVHCVYCGHVNPDGSTVCLSCGRTLPPAPGGASSFGQPPQQQQPSWGEAPQAPPSPSYPPPGGPSSFPPAQDPNAQWQGGSSFGNQAPSFGQPPAPSSFGQPASPWGAPAPAAGFGAPGGSDAASAKQLAMIGMIVGIVGALLGWCCYSGFLFGPAALILGFIAKSKLTSAGSQDGSGMAMAAIGLGILATIEPIVYLIIVFLIIGVGGGFNF